MANILNLQADINTALSPLAYPIYYTVTPDGPVYPHIFIFIVSDDVTPHKNWSTSADIARVRVQIEVRSTTQLSANTILNAVYTQLKAQETLQLRPVGSSNPITWDAQHNVYRAMLDVVVNYT